MNDGRVRVGRWAEKRPRARDDHAPRTHSFVVVGFHLGGRVRIDHHGEHELEAGAVHLVPAGDPHRVLATARDAEVRSLSFCTPCLPRESFGEVLLPFERVRRGARPFVMLPKERHGHVISLLDELERESAGLDARGTSAPSPTRKASPLVTESLLALVLAEIARADEATRSAPEHHTASLVAEALTLIEARCLEPLTLTEIAETLGKTPSHLTTAVRRATGRTVKEWILEGRIAEAKRRLESTDERIDIVAERVGYTDPSHFVRMFRERVGTSPSVFRKESRKPRG